MHFLSIAPLPPVQRVQYCLLYNATTEKADKFPLLDVPGDKQPLPLVSAGVHVLYVCTTNLKLIKIKNSFLFRSPDPNIVCSVRRSYFYCLQTCYFSIM